MHPVGIHYVLMRCHRDKMTFMVDTRAKEPIYCPYCKQEVEYDG